MLDAFNDLQGDESAFFFVNLATPYDYERSAKRALDAVRKNFHYVVRF